MSCALGDDGPATVRIWFGPAGAQPDDGLNEGKWVL